MNVHLSFKICLSSHISKAYISLTIIELNETNIVQLVYIYKCNDCQSLVIWKFPHPHCIQHSTLLPYSITFGDQAANLIVCNIVNILSISVSNSAHQ